MGNALQHDFSDKPGSDKLRDFSQEQKASSLLALLKFVVVE